MSKVDIELSKEEALILFEVLSRYSESEELTVCDDAERQSLWNLCSALEKELSEPFSKDWKSALHSAKDKLTT